MKDPQSEETRLLDLLVRAAAGGKIGSGLALPVIAEILTASGSNVPVLGTAESLLQLLGDRGGDEAASLRDWLRRRRKEEALRFHRDSGNDGGTGDFKFFLGRLPLTVVPTWTPYAAVSKSYATGLAAADDLAFLKREQLLDRVPDLAGQLQDELMSASLRFRKSGDGARLIEAGLVERLEGCPAGLVAKMIARVRNFEMRQRERIGGELRAGRFPTGANESLLLEALRTQIADPDLPLERRRSILIACCQWETPALEPIVTQLAKDPQLEDSANLLLMMRFGTVVTEHPSPVEWLQRCRQKYEAAADDAPASLLMRLWLAADREVGSEDVAELEKAIAEKSDTTNLALAKRWRSQLTDREAEILAGEDRQIEAVPDKQTKGRLPTLWSEHVQPFVVENWYMVAGIFMTIVGASLLAFYTWDRHWLIRYTLMPGLLALFTAGLARSGTWIAAKGAEFFGTASMLRGAAIGLLPVNFMAVALLSGDEQVSQKLLAVSVMGLIYVVLAGWGLWRWCRAEHRSLALPMGATLLALNSLVALAPLAASFGGGQMHAIVVGAGFYVGFALAAASVVWFGLRSLEPSMAVERRIPWFFFAGLVATFVQVFLWVHGHARTWPQVHTYAPLVVLSGGLALFYDLRVAMLSGERAGGEKLGGVTALGFGMAVLGVVMAIGDAYVRVLALFLAGCIWVLQGLWRERLEATHFWIGLTSLALAVGSVGLLEAFPKRWLPALGMGFAAVALALAPAARRLRTGLAEALRGMHFVSLVITVVVSVLTQWHLETPPGQTALWLVAIAAVFGLGARRERSVRWVHVAMLVLAVAVPYMGFVDMLGREWRGNTVIFGLSIVSMVWIGMTCFPARFPTAVRARSTVLWFYGLLAVVAMIIRIYWEGARPPGIGGFAKMMDLGGPCLMAGALMLASYFSRSLVAGGMAAVILVILFPELKATFEEVLPANLWGSGIGSTSTALGLVVLAFWLRGAKFLRDLQAGDRFLDRYEFPLRRFDHTLATLPVIASVIFLTAKIMIRNGVMYFDALGTGGGIGVLFSAALVISSVVCVLLAIYFRSHWMRSRILVQLGMAVFVVGVFALSERLFPESTWSWPALVSLAGMLGLLLLSEFGLRRFGWAQDTLARPVAAGLSVWSVAAATVATVAMGAGIEVVELWGLVVFVAGLCAWLELRYRCLVHGVLLFLLVWSAAVVGRTDAVAPTLWVMVAILALGTGLESVRIGKSLWPLLRIQLWLATLVVVALGVLELGFGLPWNEGSMWLLFVALALASRAHRSTAIAVLAIAVGYFWGGGSLWASNSAGLEARGARVADGARGTDWQMVVRASAACAAWTATDAAVSDLGPPVDGLDGRRMCDRLFAGVRACAGPVFVLGQATPGEPAVPVAYLCRASAGGDRMV